MMQLEYLRLGQVAYRGCIRPQRIDELHVLILDLEVVTVHN